MPNFNFIQLEKRRREEAEKLQGESQTETDRREALKGLYTSLRSYIDH